ncbi:hypothetical protein V500_03683 [Pseudogymnoascus sp. VKM F-4518 (FW-2643)]|nr:hypothetical protein V500_03683 [Pseudogymnoascus sp. VKM F-4518 (FW-2643)]
MTGVIVSKNAFDSNDCMHSEQAEGEQAEGWYAGVMQRAGKKAYSGDGFDSQDCLHSDQADSEQAEGRHSEQADGKQAEGWYAGVRVRMALAVRTAFTASKQRVGNYSAGQ